MQFLFVAFALFAAAAAGPLGVLTAPGTQLEALEPVNIAPEYVMVAEAFVDESAPLAKVPELVRVAETVRADVREKVAVAEYFLESVAVAPAVMPMTHELVRISVLPNTGGVLRKDFGAIEMSKETVRVAALPEKVAVAEYFLESVAVAPAVMPMAPELVRIAVLPNTAAVLRQAVGADASEMVAVAEYFPVADAAAVAAAAIAMTPETVRVAVLPETVAVAEHLL